MKKDKVSVAERQIQALKLRARGKSYEYIANELGFAGPSGAYATIQRALRELKRENREELIDIELARLDELLDGVWEKAISGNDKAINAVMQIMARRAKYLGLDSATQVETKWEVEYVNDWRGKAEDLEDIDNEDAGKINLD